MDNTCVKSPDTKLVDELDEKLKACKKWRSHYVFSTATLRGDRVWDTEDLARQDANRVVELNKSFGDRLNVYDSFGNGPVKFNTLKFHLQLPEIN